MSDVNWDGGQTAKGVGEYIRVGREGKGEGKSQGDSPHLSFLNSR